MEVKLKTSWDNVTLGEYQNFCKIKPYEMEDNWDLYATYLSVFSDKDYMFWINADYDDFMSAKSLIAFADSPPQPNEIRHIYEVAGVKYNIAKSIPSLKKCPISELKGLQMISLQECSLTNSELSYEEIIDNLHIQLSLMMIPEGMEYGKDGYSISENAEHLQNNLHICDALSVANFFLLLYKGLTAGLKTSLEKKIKRLMKMDNKSDQMELLMEMKKLLSTLDHKIVL